jgi:hypothetical protein
MEKTMVTVRQEEIGVYEDGGVLFTHVHQDGEMTAEFNMNDFVLSYIDSEDDAMGVVANAAYSDQLV